MQELLYRPVVDPTNYTMIEGFDARAYTTTYEDRVPPSLEIDYHPTSEFDRHQHVFYMTALEGLYDEIDQLESGRRTQAKRDSLQTCYQQLSQLNHDRAAYEMRRNKDDEAVFFAGRVTNFEHKLLLFETAYELGHAPVLLKLGNLRAEAEASDKPLESMSAYLLSEIKLGLRVAENTQDLTALFEDKNNTTSLNVFVLGSALTYAGVKAIERQDEAVFEAVVKSLIYKNKNLQLLHDLGKARHLHATGLNQRLRRDERKSTKQLRKSYKPGAKGGGEVSRVIVGLSGSITYRARAKAADSTYLSLRNKLSEDFYRANTPEFRLRSSWSTPEYKREYLELLKVIDTNAKPEKLLEMMNRGMALALVETDAKHDEVAGKIAGLIEATRHERQHRQQSGFVDTIDASTFRTTYNRRLDTLVNAAERVGDLLIRLNLLCEVAELQLEHDQSVDSSSKAQLDKIKALGTALVSNQVGLYKAETPAIKARLKALGVTIK